MTRKERYQFNMNNQRRGILFVLSGPSGAGKGTLRKILFEKIPDLHFSVSWTTRNPRQNEVPHRDYVFVEEKTFRDLMEQEGFLEWAMVHDHYYGTPRKEVEAHLAQGRDVLLEIDVQGALTVKKTYPEAVLIFVMPPSQEELLKRLAKRKSESPEEISLRLRNAEEEISHSGEYDYRLVNQEVDVAAADLVDLVHYLRTKKG
jgi:guanylate kinase